MRNWNQLEEQHSRESQIHCKHIVTGVSLSMDESEESHSSNA